MKQLFIFFSVIIMVLTIVFTINGNNTKLATVDENYSSTQIITQFFQNINIASQTISPTINSQKEKELFELGHYFNNPLAVIECSQDEYISLPEREAELFGLFSQEGIDDKFVYSFKVKEFSPDIWKITDLTKMASFDIIEDLNKDVKNKEHRNCSNCSGRECLMKAVVRYLRSITTASRLIAKNKEIYLDQYLLDLISVAKNKEIKFEIISNYNIQDYTLLVVQISNIEDGKIKFDNSKVLRSDKLLFELEKEEGLWKIINISN